MKKYNLLALISCLALILAYVYRGVIMGVFSYAMSIDDFIEQLEFMSKLEPWLKNVSFLEFVPLVAWGGILIFFVKFYKIQTEDMKKTSLLSLIGVSLIVAIELLTRFDVVDSASFLTFLAWLEVAGFALLAPFFYSLYKKSE